MCGTPVDHKSSITVSPGPVSEWVKKCQKRQIKAKHSFRIAYLNINSLSTGIEDMFSVVRDLDFTILGVTETWLTCQKFSKEVE